MTNTHRRFRLWAVLALAAGLLLRLWFIRHLAHVAGDSLVYGDIAKNLMLHHIYGFTEHTDAGALQIRSTLIRLPGYPLFLVACFRLFGLEHYGAVLYMQLAADLVTCWLAASLAARLFGQRSFLPVLWLAALCPFTANYVAAPLTETLVLTSIALTFYSFARWQRQAYGSDLPPAARVELQPSKPTPWNPWLWLTATALSASLLLRPEQGLLSAGVLPAMLWVTLTSPARRARPLHSAAPVVASALAVVLPLVPWTARNWHTLGVFQPLAPRSASDPGELQLNGFNRWYRTWANDFASTDDVYWNYDGNAIEISDLPARALAPGCHAPRGIPRESLPLYGPTAALLDDYNQTTTATPANDAAWDQLAAQRIHAAPLCYYAVLPAARVLNMLFRPRTEMMPIPVEWWKPPATRRQTLFAAAYATLDALYVILALAGLRAWQHRRFSISGGTPGGPLAVAMLASLLLRIALLLTLDNSEPRYTLEFFPILFVLTGALFILPRPSLTTDH